MIAYRYCVRMHSAAMVASILTMISVTLATPAASAMIGEKDSQCEEITIPMCKGIGYNYTSMPNIFHHDTQDEAGLEVHQFWPLVEIHCSDDLRFFLCSMYTPICIPDYQGRLPACRSVCERARAGCAPIMRQYGFSWPERMSCEDLPVFGDQKNLCMDSKEGAHPSSSNSHPGPSTTTIEKSTIKPAVPMPPKAQPKHTPNHNQNINNVTRPTIEKPRLPPITPVVDIRFTCPAQFKTPPGLDYIFRLHGKEYKDCGQPCDGMLFSRDDRKDLQRWIGTWAVICVISTLFTVFTFLTDTSRFRYPERPIIFLSLCYLCIGLAYVAGFTLGDQVSCNDPFPPHRDQLNAQMISTTTQGNKKESCLLLFMTLYFFTISSSIWWVILTLTWFLAAGLKWSLEGIESNTHIFHLFGWVAPAISTILVLAMGKVEGDVLSGVCYVGIMNQSAQRYFVFLPLMTCLVIGCMFLVAGFVSLWRIRTIMKIDGARTEKLETLMWRIGGFSALYMFTTAVSLCCYYYEQQHLDEWLTAWLTDICQKRDYGIPCPILVNDVRPQRPLFVIFMIKYLAIFLAGISSGVWIWSEKTVNSWANVYKKLCCRKRPETFL